MLPRSGPRNTSSSHGNSSPDFYCLKQIAGLPSSQTHTQHFPGPTQPAGFPGGPEGRASPHSGQLAAPLHSGTPSPRRLLPADTVLPTGQGRRAERWEAVPAGSRKHTGRSVPLSSMTDERHWQSPPPSPSSWGCTPNLALEVQLICSLGGRDSSKHLPVILASFPSSNMVFHSTFLTTFRK